MRDNDQLSAPKLYHLVLYGKNILYSTQTNHPHYLELELHFPYKGIKVDFFDDDVNFTEDNIKRNLADIAENIVFTLRTVFEKFRELTDQERHEILEGTSVREHLRTVLETECISYCSMNWGKTALDSVSHILTKYLQQKDFNLLVYSEFDYPQVYKELFYHFGGCESVNYYLPNVQKNYWFRKYESVEKNPTVTLKKLNCYYHTNTLPESKTHMVGYEEFIKPEENMIPFFIGTQFGTTPKITRKLKNDLEGQKIAVLRKSQLSGFEKVLQICKVTDGTFVVLEEYLNTADDTTIGEMTPDHLNTSAIFSPEKIIYRYFNEGRRYFVTKKDNPEFGSFVITMLRPFRNVQWFYPENENLNERERQQIIPSLTKYLHELYSMVEKNTLMWKHNFKVFKTKNQNNSAEFNLSLYTEMLYTEIIKDTKLFPANLSSFQTSVFFKTILREMLETGNFNSVIESMPYLGFEYMMHEENRTLIDITAYNCAEREKVFSELTDREKINLYAAMKQGYGSQFDSLVTGWIKFSDETLK